MIDERLYARGVQTLLASWAAYARGSRGAAVIRSAGVASAVFPEEPERSVYNNAVLERGLGLGARQPIGAGARQFSPPRRLVDVGGTQRIGFDAGLIDERHSARRAGCQDELGPADHFCLRRECMDGCGEPGEARLFESVGDTALGQIVRGHLDQDLVARQHADAVLAHAASGVGDDLMFVF